MYTIIYRQSPPASNVMLRYAVATIIILAALAALVPAPSPSLPQLLSLNRQTQTTARKRTYNSVSLALHFLA